MSQTNGMFKIDVGGNVTICPQEQNLKQQAYTYKMIFQLKKEGALMLKSSGVSNMIVFQFYCTFCT